MRKLMRAALLSLLLASTAALGQVTPNCNITGACAVPAYTPTTDVTFAAGNFTGSASMTWTVAAGDVSAYAYSIVGNMMTVWFNLQTTTVGGTPDRYLQLAIPAGRTASRSVYNPFLYNNGSWIVGQASVTTSTALIRLERIDNSSWVAGTDTIYASGQITFPIN